MAKNTEYADETEHPLLKVWNRHPGFLQSKTEIYRAPSIEKIIAEIFSVGEHYYYTLHMTDSSISSHHPNLLKMHGFANPPTHLGDIIGLIHPDDMTFVEEAELMTVEKIREIGFEHMMQLKSSYCFRLRMASGAYEMFHHQSVHTLKSESGHLLEAVNIHTNINHLAPRNNYHVLVSGIGGRNDFHQMRWAKRHNDMAETQPLSKRELEIVALLAKGLNTRSISEKLYISQHTVKTHRKNILSKTQCKNSSELICLAFEQGYV
ncbi:MAG: response regulator transcription factor [Flavobacteriia bacterium]|nr:response regulator transcription factor [Flavobacteriia bacterium]